MTALVSVLTRIVQISDRSHKSPGSSEDPSTNNSFKLELMELENIVANTVYLKAREGERMSLHGSS